MPRRKRRLKHNIMTRFKNPNIQNERITMKKYTNED